MYALLAEKPLLISLMLGVLGGGLIYGWLQTGKKPAAVAGLVLLLLIPLAWFLAARLETDREQVERLIYEVAAAVERNDAEAAIVVIADPDLRNRARNELSRWTFTLARVNRLRSIEIVEGSYPLEAIVEMSVKVDVSSRGGSMRNVRVARKLDLKFQKTRDQWHVIDYEHSPIAGSGP
jgi:hypothetical protein